MYHGLSFQLYYYTSLEETVWAVFGNFFSYGILIVLMIIDRRRERTIK